MGRKPRAPTYLGPKVDAWLKSKSTSTRNVYPIAMKKYLLEYWKMTDDELLAEVNLEATKPLTEQGVIKRAVKQFFNWLTRDHYALSENLGATYVSAVMSFYRYYNYKVPLKIGTELKPTAKHQKVNLTNADIRLLCSHAKTVRIGTKTVMYEEEHEKWLLHCFETNQTIDGLCEIDLDPGMGLLYKMFVWA